MSTVPGAGVKTGKRKKRGSGGCCGCLIVLLLVLGGSLWLARKWAPNHLNRGLEWGRMQVVAKYPLLDRWLPKTAAPPPSTVFEPTAPPQPPTPTASPTPVPLATPALQATPTPEATAEPSAPPVVAGAPDAVRTTELVVGTGAIAAVGHTVEVRYSAAQAGVPERFMLGAGDVDEALDRGVRGMRVGGKRKIGESELELVKIL